jgi:hypothetical protein
VLNDFVPLGATGRTLRFPEYRREFEEGISVYDDFDHACAMARKNRFRQGRFLVKLVIPKMAAWNSGEHLPSTTTRSSQTQIISCRLLNVKPFRFWPLLETKA